MTDEHSSISMPFCVPDLKKI